MCKPPALERLLHRLCLSTHRERFVLKAAMLLTTWFEEPHRAADPKRRMRVAAPPLLRCFACSNKRGT
jgi:hypothetical protein